MKIAIHQPNYIPWCGYFSKMNNSNIFVLLDDVEISPGQSYVYRTKILTKNGPIWLSVPCHRPESTLIKDVEIVDNGWNKKHLRSISQAYGKMPYFNDFFPNIEPIFLNPGKNLAMFNKLLITIIASYLKLDCKIINSSDLNHDGQGDERLISISQSVNSDTYISGKGGSNYQEPEKFLNAGINLEVKEYIPISYQQILDGFISGLSIIDAIFSLGPSTVNLLHYQ